MTDLPYTLTIDGASGLIEAVMTGFWNAAQCEHFISEMREAQEKIEQLGKAPLSLIDVRGQSAQSQEVVAALQQFASDSISRKRRTAVIVGSALLKLQAHRIAASDVHQIFTDPAEGRRWLLE